MDRRQPPVGAGDPLRLRPARGDLGDGRLADALRHVVPTWIAAEQPAEGGTDSLPCEELLAAADPEQRDEPVALDDPCLVMYTSGTTGRPKGATLTHGNMTWNAVHTSMGLDVTGSERTLALAPLFHIGGLNGTVNPALLRGGCAVVLRRFDPPETLAVIEEQRVTSFFAVPTMLDAMSREPGSCTRDVSALRTIGAAGAPLPLPTLRTWLDPRRDDAAVDPEDLRLRLRDRLAAFTVPQYVEFVDELPKTATGKVRKPDLRATFVPTEETPA